MSSVQAHPYRTLTNNQITVKEWYPVNHEDIPTQMDTADNGVPEWTYDDLLRLGREIRIDADECFETIGLGNDQAELKLTVLLEAGQPGIRHSVYSKTLSAGEVLDEFMVVETPGSYVSENVKLTTVITLNSAHETNEPFIPRLSGSRLWEDRHVIPLEGQGSRFPMRTCSFQTLIRVPDNADWFLEWSPELADHAFAGTVLLYINTDNKEFSNLVTEGDEAVLNGLRSDITIEMCAGMLANKEFREGHEVYEPGSIGAVCVSWLNMVYPGRSRENLYQILQDRTSEFFASLRAAFK